MNFYDHFIKQLTERGVFKNQAEEIMEKVMVGLRDSITRERFSPGQ
jgi:uncharacterized protein YutE (UPF0331/DUF86 family)